VSPERSFVKNQEGAEGYGFESQGTLWVSFMLEILNEDEGKD
jgi:hypothetical protein